MGTPRCEVDKWFLMPAKDGMHATLHQKGALDRGTEPPIAYQHVGGRSCRVQIDDLGQIMGAPGSGDHAEPQAGTRLPQRPHGGNWQATASVLPPRLTKRLWPCRGIGHRTTRTIAPQGAMAHPAALVQRLVL